MDYKITKFDLTAEELKFEQTAEIPIDTDISLADYEPDIIRLLKCEITPFISSKRISGNALGIEGNVLLTVIYCDNEGKLYSTEAELPYKKLFEAASMLEGGNCEVNLSATVHSCRAVTERKFSIKASVKLEVAVYINKKISIISDIDSNCFEQLCGETKATTPLAMSEKSFILDEEITLDSSCENIAKIIKTDIVPIINENKNINSKIVAKGDINIDCFYLSKNGNLCKHRVSMPFNQILDFVGINDECECDTSISVCGISVSPRTNQSGECRSFVLVAKFCITARARCDSNVPVIFDAYSTKYSVIPKKEEITFNKIVHNSCQTFSCQKSLQLPNEQYKNISGLWCKSNGCYARYSENVMKLIGSITVCAIVTNEQNEHTLIERMIDYEYPLEITEKLRSPTCRPICEIIKYDYSYLTGGNIDLRLDLLFKSTVYDISTVNLITDVTVDEASNSSYNNCSLVAYYADTGEELWEIAKSFSACKKDIMEFNNIKEEVISSPCMILITAHKS